MTRTTKFKLGDLLYANGDFNAFSVGVSFYIKENTPIIFVGDWFTIGRNKVYKCYVLGKHAYISYDSLLRCK